MFQVSAMRPSTIRWMLMPVAVTGRPGGGVPINSPLCVPRPRPAIDDAVTRRELIVERDLQVRDGIAVIADEPFEALHAGPELLGGRIVMNVRGSTTGGGRPSQAP